LPGQQGFTPLCEELARIHSKVGGRDFNRDNVLLTEGGCSAISVARAAVQEPGTKVAYAVPSFPYWCTLDSL
jgi:DNA-binding transcriptional MocR family regulator